MKKRIIFKLAILGALLFLVLPAVSAHIEIADIGHFEGIEGLTGYIDCQNVAEYDLLGAILIFVDGEIAAGKIIKTRVRYVAGFRCSPIKTFEFPINESKGDHHIVAHVFSMNNSAERTYDYFVDGVEGDIALGEEGEEEDWLVCSWMCGANENRRRTNV